MIHPWLWKFAEVREGWTGNKLRTMRSEKIWKLFSRPPSTPRPWSARRWWPTYPPSPGGSARTGILIPGDNSATTTTTGLPTTTEEQTTTAVTTNEPSGQKNMNIPKSYLSPPKVLLAPLVNPRAKWPLAQGRAWPTPPRGGPGTQAVWTALLTSRRGLPVTNWDSPVKISLLEEGIKCLLLKERKLLG